MSYIKKVQGQPDCMSLATFYLEEGRYLARLHRRRRAYAPTSNTASRDNYEKINSWVSFSFLYGYGAQLGVRAARAPLKLHGKWYHEKHFQYVLITNSKNRFNATFNVSDSLPLVGGLV